MSRKITTILLDCDNTLVLSEDLAFSGCADLVNQINRDKHLNLPIYDGPSLRRAYVGQNFRSMITSVAKKNGVAIEDNELEGYVKCEEEIVIAKLRRELRPCDGVPEALEAVDGRYTLAVVSSSALKRVGVSLDVTKLGGYFGDRIYSAASMPTPTSKPDPAVYRYAMVGLKVTPEQCVAIEDSESGTLSAVAAGIRTVGYVGAYPPEEREHMTHVLREAGAGVVMDNWAQFGELLGGHDL